MAGLTVFASVEATQQERAERRPGDDLVTPADVVMDRGFTVPGTPDEVWPWIQQLGKQRAGWYLSRRLEQIIPRKRRASTCIDSRWQHLQVGDVIPDYGGRRETFTVAEIGAPNTLVYHSQRGDMAVSWSIVLRPTGQHDGHVGGPALAHTRVLLRLRLGPIKRVWLVNSVGELIDLLTIAGMATGLRERLVALRVTARLASQISASTPRYIAVARMMWPSHERVGGLWRAG